MEPRALPLVAVLAAENVPGVNIMNHFGQKFMG
jgi:hypothetical protein